MNLTSVIKRSLLPSTLLVGFVMPVAAADGVDLAQTPLFVSPKAQHNLLFMMDDSRHMDLEVLMAGADYGRLDSDGMLNWLGELVDQTLPTGSSGPLAALKTSVTSALVGSVNYGYLFETGVSDPYNGQRLNRDYDVLPPLAPYAFSRSAAYNPQFYDPAVDYRPWQSTAAQAYPDAEVSNPLLDPNYPQRFDDPISGGILSSLLTFGGESIDRVTAYLLCNLLRLDLPFCSARSSPFTSTQIAPFAVSDIMASALGAVGAANAVITETSAGLVPISRSRRTLLGPVTDYLTCNVDAVRSDLLGVLDGSALQKNYVCIAHNPATYFVPEDEGRFRFLVPPALGFEGQCSAPEPDHFRRYVEQYGVGSLLQFEDADGNPFEGALAPDGRCLRKVVLDGGQQRFSGPGYDRDYAGELQNFANWFTYHRRRHQSIRAGLGESLAGIGAVRADVLTVNDSTATAVMKETRDRASGGDLDQLLYQVHHAYDDAPASNEAPLRQALNLLGTQYQRRDADAPVQYECQRNYGLLYTDGFATDYGSHRSVGNADLGAGAPYENTAADSLGDIAMHYYQTNLRPDLPTGQVRVPGQCGDDSVDPRLDCNSNLHMNTYGVLLGNGGSVYGSPGYETVAEAHRSPPTWPDVNTESDDILRYQVDDLYNATVNGRGEIHNARLPSDIVSGLNRALADIEDQAGAAGAVTFSSALVESDTLIFSAAFNSHRWSGSLSARELNSRNGRLVQEGGSYIGDRQWEAADLLDARDLASSPRQILTYDPAQAVSRPFRWQSLASHQRADLEASDATLAEARLDYLRGDRSREGGAGGLRPRASRLGDIVHSSPVFVAEPRMGWPDRAPYGDIGERYSDFRTNEAIRQRPATVYVGANDGMLHAFTAATGEELFAYVPDLVFDTAAQAGLSYLTDPAYGHRYYVDLTPAVADAYIDSGAGDAWHTVLVGGLRAGGRGLFALDITAPEAISEFSADKLALWEFRHEDLGYVTEPVNIMLARWGSGYEWVAVFGNGYGAPSGRSGLFMLRLEGGIDGRWTEGTDFRFIETAAAGSGAVAGLTSDVRLIDLDDDQLVDRVYAGDLRGRIWSFTANDSGQWGSAYSRRERGVDYPQPLFSAASGQPVTAAPMVVRNPYTETTAGNAPDLLVLFGTGQYFSQADVNNTGLQSFYGVWDAGVGGLGRADLLARDISERSVSEGLIRDLGEGGLEWGSSGGRHMGWLVDFDTRAGERVVQVPQVRGSTILFNTTLPPTNTCSSDGGSFRMFLDLDGTNPDRPVLDTSRDGRVNSADLPVAGLFFGQGLLSQSQVLGKVMFDNTAGGTAPADALTNENVVDFGDRTLRGRLGWREIIVR
ncbi:MAG: PilC/PilY family type IV pilus protein [Marinobacter sp.]|uniref:pilus assembly protein n=1 Tax=Marinobacter sp. TaxID=50741 RepID=UPI00299DC20C|nr:PilC/PilY family type IV pilus protein [Marinobacter sp.]MDX1634645.1 PilC/PilY family type IV pilus protein [Marinobacter sp.]